MKESRCSLCSISVVFLAHTHIHDCEHVIKFVMEEIRETALWKVFLNLDKFLKPESFLSIIL